MLPLIDSNQEDEEYLKSEYLRNGMGRNMLDDDDEIGKELDEIENLM